MPFVVDMATPHPMNFTTGKPATIKQICLPPFGLNTPNETAVWAFLGGDRPPARRSYADRFWKAPLSLHYTNLLAPGWWYATIESYGGATPSVSAERC